ASGLPCWYQITLWTGGFVIIILGVAVTVLVNSTCKVCPVQWQLHRDKCYWQSEDTKTWNESQHDCSTRDSHLLVIQDKQEMDFIKNITKNAKFWIGLSLSLAENKWMWITGSQLDQSL
ncbi:Hypothetical predicted protein, partial [Podarcis lilfordi]